MALLDDLVTQALNQQKASFLSSLQASKDAAQADIDSQLEALNKQEDSIQGFKIGIIAPAYQGDLAGSLIRDPLGLSTGDPTSHSDPAATPSVGEMIGAVVGIYIFYHFILRRHLHG